MSASLSGIELVSRELAAIRSRTRRFVWASLAVHVSLLLGIMLYRAIVPEQPRLVEITWLGPEEPTEVAAPVKTRPPRQTTAKSTSFIRKTKRGDIAPLDRVKDLNVRLENKVAELSDGSLVAVDWRTGEERWSKRIGEGRYPDLVAEPAVHGGDLYTLYFPIFDWPGDGRLELPGLENKVVSARVVRPDSDAPTIPIASRGRPRAVVTALCRR